jgi:hypothetical protein
LWLAFRIIFDIHFHSHDASLRAGMIRRRVPRVGRQLDIREFLYGQTTPIGPRTGFVQPADAVSAVLIAENTALFVLIPPQTVRTKLPLAPVVYRGDWLSPANGEPQAPVHLFQKLTWGHTLFSAYRPKINRSYLIETTAIL